jgi:hypothetical protein
MAVIKAVIRLDQALSEIHKLVAVQNVLLALIFLLQTIF